MKTAEVSFILVTPCILGGANPREKAEMRVPSIRGMLRWWYRALGYDPEEEYLYFGGKDPQGNPVSSKLVIRDSTPAMLCSEKKNGQQIIGQEYDYFLWPFPGKDSKSGLERTRGILKEGQLITLQITTRPVKPEKHIQFDDKVLKAFLLLGSLGTRSTRCYGSIYPMSVTIDGKPWKIPQSIDDLERECMKVIGDPRGDDTPRIRILVLDTAKQSWKEAVHTCSRFLKAYRCGSSQYGQRPSQWGKNDHDLIKGNIQKLYRPSLGLPLVQSYKKGTKRIKIEIVGYDRLRSPVCFKVLKLQGGYWPIAIFFPEKTLPPSESSDLPPIKEILVDGEERDLTLSDDLFYAMMEPNTSIWEGKVRCIYSSL